MNDVVEDAPREVPVEALALLPSGVNVQGLKRVSDGWHEGYALNLSAPLEEGEQPRVVLRIWRSQLSYWRLEVPTSAAVELRAVEIAREAGLPTATVASAVGADGVAVRLCGVCARAPRGECCDWAIFNFIPHASERQARKAIRAATGSESKFLVRTMARLHSLSLLDRDTAPLARFEDWRQHTAYLTGLAAESGIAYAARAAEAAAVALEAAAPPELPPAICHFDWHLGNVLCDSAGCLVAVIDWEFAGVADPRLDMARLCRQVRWSGDGASCRERVSAPEAAELWAEYAAARFGPGVDVLAALGPMEPWLVLESALVLVTGAALCSRVVHSQQQGGQLAMEAPEAAGGAGGALPRCDLLEWLEDMETAKFQLRRMGLM